MKTTDLDIMARTVWGEARGESYDGMKAVAHVILNRVAKTYRGKLHLSDVCADPKQFSCWNHGDPNLARIAFIGLHDAGYRQCARAVLDAVEEHATGRDPTKGSLHYHITKMLFPEAWGAPQKPAAKIGNHLFYNTVK